MIGKCWRPSLIPIRLVKFALELILYALDHSTMCIWYPPTTNSVRPQHL